MEKVNRLRQCRSFPHPSPPFFLFFHLCCKKFNRHSHFNEHTEFRSIFIQFSQVATSWVDVLLKIDSVSFKYMSSNIFPLKWRPFHCVSTFGKTHTQASSPKPINQTLSNSHLSLLVVYRDTT